MTVFPLTALLFVSRFRQIQLVGSYLQKKIRRCVLAQFRSHYALRFIWFTIRYKTNNPDFSTYLSMHALAQV